MGSHRDWRPKDLGHAGEPCTQGLDHAECKVQDSISSLNPSPCRVQDSGFIVWGTGCRIHGWILHPAPLKPRPGPCTPKAWAMQVNLAPCTLNLAPCTLNIELRTHTWAVNYFTERRSGSEAGSYLRRIDFVYHSTLGSRVMKKKREGHRH